jgi:hypothetical protein
MSDVTLEKKLSIEAKGEPAIVLLYVPSDEEKVDDCESEFMEHEEVALSMEHFRLFRLNVDTIVRKEVRESFGSTPATLFFDPNGKKIADLRGRNASSCKAIMATVERAWSDTYTVSWRRWTKAAQKLLDRRDELAETRMEIQVDRERLREKPNPRKERAIERVEEKLRKEEEELREAQYAHEDEVKLRPEFTAVAEPDSSREG